MILMGKPVSWRWGSKKEKMYVHFTFVTVADSRGRAGGCIGEVVVMHDLWHKDISTPEPGKLGLEAETCFHVWELSEPLSSPAADLKA